MSPGFSFVLLISTALLSACGGSGGGSSAPKSPVISVSAPTKAASGASVRLDASATSDVDGDGLIFSWEQTAGPAISLDLSEPEMPMFVVPDLDAPDTATFQLTVSDGEHDVTETISLNIVPFAQTVTRLLSIIEGDSEFEAIQRQGEYEPVSLEALIGTQQDVRWISGGLNDGRNVVAAIYENESATTLHDLVTHDLATNETRSLADVIRAQVGLAPDTTFTRAVVLSRVSSLFAITADSAYGVALDGSRAWRVHGPGVFLLDGDAANWQGPSFSPDGNQVALIGRAAGSGGPGLFVMPLDGSAPPQQYSAAFADINGDSEITGGFSGQIPHWSPDGNRVAFTADYDEDGFLELHAADTETGVQRQISDSGHAVAHSMWFWHPDSEQLIYRASPDITNPNAKNKVFLSSYTTPVAQMVADGLIQAEERANIISFTPDGRFACMTTFDPGRVLAQEIGTTLTYELVPSQANFAFRDYTRTSGAAFYWVDPEGAPPRIFVSEPAAGRIQVDITPTSIKNTFKLASNISSDGRLYYATGVEGEPADELWAIDKNGDAEMLQAALPDDMTEWTAGGWTTSPSGFAPFLAVARDTDGNTTATVTVLLNTSTSEAEIINHDLGNGRRISWIGFFKPE